MKWTKTMLVILFLGAGMIVKAHTNPGTEKNKPVEPEDVYGSVSQSGKDKPLKDVIITAFLQSKKEKVVVSNTNGEYGLDGLTPGTYKLVFEKDGYKKVVKEKVIVKPNSGIELNVEMESKGYELSPSPFHFIEF